MRSPRRPIFSLPFFSTHTHAHTHTRDDGTIRGKITSVCHSTATPVRARVCVCVCVRVRVKKCVATKLDAHQAPVGSRASQAVRAPMGSPRRPIFSLPFFFTHTHAHTHTRDDGTIRGRMTSVCHSAVMPGRACVCVCVCVRVCVTKCVATDEANRPI